MFAQSLAANVPIRVLELGRPEHVRHPMTQNTDRAQRVQAADPCDKVLLRGTVAP